MKDLQKIKITPKILWGCALAVKISCQKRCEEGWLTGEGCTFFPDISSTKWEKSIFNSLLFL